MLELNEPPAAPAFAVCDEIRIGSDDARLDPDGGAIALGDPVGATGAGMVVKALDLLRHGGGRCAPMTTCIGGGRRSAVILEPIP